MRLLRRRWRGVGADDRPPVRRGQDALQEGQRDEGLAEHQYLLAAPRRHRAELEQPDYFGAAPDQICGASPITTNSSSSPPPPPPPPPPLRFASADFPPHSWRSTPSTTTTTTTMTTGAVAANPKFRTRLPGK